MHSSSGTTQPILCCIGQSAAGSPTQFMIERAIAATEVDWRAITAEVTTEELQIALSGMFAMKFMAVRFLPSLQVPALGQLAGDDERLVFVGAITSTARTAEGWQAWHHWGPAILNLARGRVDLSQTLCWLHGDTVRVRSMLIALYEAAKQNEALPGAVVWTNAATAIPTELITLAQAAKPLKLQLIGDSQLREHGALSLLRGVATESELVNLLLVGEELPYIADELTEDATVDFAQCMVAGGELCRQPAELLWPHLTIFNEADQIVACEVYDFQRWTGQCVDSTVLRDAYDEYCDF